MENKENNWCYHCMLEQKQEGELCSVCHTGGVEENPPEFLPLGIFLQEDRFLVGEFLGYGGQIATYMARDLQENKAVLLKEFFPFPEVVREKESTTLLLNKENNLHFKTLKSDFVDLYQKLEGMNRCSSVEKVYCLFEDNATSYAVTKPVRGMTLREYVSNFPQGMKVSIAKQIAIDMLLAVEELHKNGIIHGTINPDTVMFDRKKNVVFKDFVLLSAKEKIDDSHLGFMAPEQYTNATFQGTYSDVYAVAACLYWMLTAIDPQKADGDADNYAILVELKKLPEDTPPHVAKALEKAMQVKIAERTDKAIDFIIALEQELPVEAAAESASEAESETDEKKREKKEKPPRVGLKNWIAFLATLLVTIGIMTAFFFSDIGSKWMGNILNRGDNTAASTEKEADTEGKLAVPNLVGMTQEQAQDLMKEEKNKAHFRYKFAYTYVDSESNKDKVVLQMPEAGTVSSKGTTVTITLGKIG